MGVQNTCGMLREFRNAAGQNQICRRNVTFLAEKRLTREGFVWNRRRV
jgi:hypothetical protein